MVSDEDPAVKFIRTVFRLSIVVSVVLMIAAAGGSMYFSASMDDVIVEYIDKEVAPVVKENHNTLKKHRIYSTKYNTNQDKLIEEALEEIRKLQEEIAELKEGSCQ
jgi:hypothetical protein